jgi:hypothetical protein
MLDWKDRAAGEREEISPPSVKTSEEQELREYVASVIVWLETFTRETLGDHETQLWVQRLSKYPKWKLDKLGEYSGKLNGVFDYLDRINRVEDNYVKPKFEPSNEVKECGAKLFKGLSEILDNEEIENKKSAIVDLHEKLKKEYPKFSNFLNYSG